MKIKNILLMSVFALGLSSCTLTQKDNPTTTKTTVVTNTDTTTQETTITNGEPVVSTTDTNPSTSIINPVTSTTIETTPTTGVTNPVTSTTTGTIPSTSTTPTTPTTGLTTPTSSTGTTSTEVHTVFSKTYTGYYEKMNGHLSTVDDFKKTLNGIISSNLISSSYSKAWDIIAEADAVDDDNIECLYTGKKILKSNHGGNVGQWNREHVWAKSHGFGDATSNYAYYDVHHLHATEVSINSTRGNMPFDEVPNGSSDSYGNRWSSSAFEPRDEVKGDVARSLFYMVVRYESSPDLELEDKLTSTSSKEPTLGKLSTLIKWAYEDPVSEFEIRRNNEVYKYQNNRNPFIDNPEYLYYLYPQESEAYGVNLYNLADYVNSGSVTPTPGPTPTTPTTTTGTTPTTNTGTTPTSTNTGVVPTVSIPTEATTVTAAYSGSSTTSMDASANNASSLGLDPSIFTVTSIANDLNNHVGLNSAGHFRLYSSTSGVGTKLVVSVPASCKIYSISINVKQNDQYVDVWDENNDTVTADSSGNYAISGNKFTITNKATSTGKNYQVHINFVTIVYGPAN